MVKVRIVNKFPMNDPPHPLDSPICISKDCDMGWIIEKVFDGEYEVQNLPYPGEKNMDIDWSMVEYLSNGKVLMCV